jgi:hypothetical protein
MAPWAPAQNPGDTDPLISDAKKALNKFSYGKNLGTTDEYTVEFGVALRQFQSNVHVLVVFNKRPGPDVNQLGIFDWAVKKQLGILPDPTVKRKPVIFTVEGHLSDMFVGPCAFSAKALEDQGVIRWQPVGYDNHSLPFRNSTGIVELDRLTHDPVVLPPGTPWGVMCFSQGAIVGCSYFLDYIRPKRNVWPWSHFKAGVAFGNPYREKDIIASWIPDPPKRGTQGISDRRMDNTPPEWMEVSRTGDLYAENPDNNAGEHRTAIYRAVQNEWTGRDSLSEQIKEILLGGPRELWAVFEAIAGGVQFITNMASHGTYDLGPGIEHMRRHLAA